MEDMGLSAEATIDFPSINATLTSQTSWRDWSFQQGMDLDYTGADILYRENDGSNGYGVDNLTQEIRLAGTTDADAGRERRPGPQRLPPARPDRRHPAAAAVGATFVLELVQVL